MFYHTSLPSHSQPFLMLPLPTTPSSTLFPYTTLFRSTRARRRPDSAARSTFSRAPSFAGSRLRLSRLCGLDRKSTRLNSSHRTISYAVFCLKKKKKLIHWVHGSYGILCDLLL